MTPTRSRSAPSLVLLSSVLLAAAPLAAQRKATPQPTDPLAHDSVVQLAKAQLGKRYVSGGDQPSRGFDCSGLIRYVYSAFNLRPPRTSALQALFGQEVPRDTAKLRPGDLLTFGYGERVSHIGIYVGNGRYIHASSGTGRVIESLLSRTGARVKPWIGARRLLAARPDSSRLNAAQ